MEDSYLYFYLLKRFFNYYRLPLSVIRRDGETIYCFPSEAKLILPKTIMQQELFRYHNSHIEFQVPFLRNTPYDSFIAIMPLPKDDFLFIGPSFSRKFSVSRVNNIADEGLKKAEILDLYTATKNLPLIDEAYLTDALSLLTLLINYKEVRPDEILRANKISVSQRTVFNAYDIIETEYNGLLLFEAQIASAIESGKETVLSHLWESFSASIKEEFIEYMYAEHHLLIPLLSSARQAALSANAPKEEVLSVFHSAISQISSRGSLSVNLKTVERTTFLLCELVKKNKNVPFYTDLCIKCEEYIDNHLGEKITASDIASYCGIDRSLVFDIFRKNYNISFTDYIRELRMKQAGILLIHSNTSISEIAVSLGYGSSSYFSKVFSTLYGCNPLDYRRKHKYIRNDTDQINL